ncbi:MAG: CBS domain-containing protein [Proteobacteria bacterium]|nr:CBS domain-containing protein [Pseudomonadota bacterium]
MTVGNLMSTALITMKANDTVGHADFEMKVASIRHIPVVDERNRLVGMVSNRDILRELGRRRGEQIVIHEIMSRQLFRVSVDAPAREAAELILDNKIGAVPVIGDEGQLVGLVTETDFVRYAYEALGGATETI